MAGKSNTRRVEEISRFKETVLDTAVALMKEEQEWGNVSVNKIAAIMRYTPPNIYHYFKNKDDIKFQLGVRGSRIIQKKLNEAIAKRYATPKDKLYAVAQQYWNFAFENEELYDLMFHTRQKKLDRDLVWSNIKIVMNAIQEVDPELDTEDKAYQSYQTLFCLIHGFISIKFNKRIPVNDRYFKQMFQAALKNHIEAI